jgi:hypothetical protein
MSTKKTHAEAIASLEKRLAVLRLRERVSERKVKERRKYLLGAYLDAYLPETGELPEKLDDLFGNQFGKKFDDWLTRDSDRALFGLPPLKAATTPNPVAAVPKDRIFLNVAYDDKENAKALGAKFDNAASKWFIPEGVDESPFVLNGWLKK